MEKVSIFKPCYMEYEGFDKPVWYGDEFLSSLAKSTDNSKLVFEKHHSKKIGDVSNFSFIDGVLFADVNTAQSLDNLGYSPSFDCNLVDKGDYWLATDGKLLEVCLTSKPRKAILNNSADNGGSQMSESNDNETIKILNNQVKDLNKQVAILENKNKANEEKLNAYTELEKEVLELREWKETNSKIIDEQKPIIEAYQKSLDARKEELLEKVSNGNEEIKSQLKDESLETLEKFDKLYAQEQPPRGISSNNAQGLDMGGSNDVDDGVSVENAASFYEEMYGEKPII